MSTPGCDEIRMAVLARKDGEAPLLDAQTCAEHIAACQPCRQELAAQEALSKLLAAHTRPSHEVSLWPSVCERLEPQPPAHVGIAVVGAILLLAYKLLEITPAMSTGLVGKLVPVLLAALVFAWMRTNPFRLVESPSPAAARPSSA